MHMKQNQKTGCEIRDGHSCSIVSNWVKWFWEKRMLVNTEVVHIMVVSGHFIGLLCTIYCAFIEMSLVVECERDILLVQLFTQNFYSYSFTKTTNKGFGVCCFFFFSWVTTVPDTSRWTVVWCL